MRYVLIFAIIALCCVNAWASTPPLVVGGEVAVVDSDKLKELLDSSISDIRNNYSDKLLLKGINKATESTVAGVKYFGEISALLNDEATNCSFEIIYQSWVEHYNTEIICNGKKFNAVKGSPAQ